MSYCLARLARVAGPGRVEVFLMDPDMPDRSFLDPAGWRLERHHPESGFGPCRDGERLIQVRHRPGRRLPEFVVHVTHLSGVYRLTCLHASVDPSWNACLFRYDPDGREPLYLRMEGLNLHGDNILHACYLDPRDQPGSLSWQVDQENGICVAGGFSLRLVDLNGDLTAALSPRRADRPLTRLARPAAPDDTLLYVDDTSDLAPEGWLYIGREAIRYEALGDGTVDGCSRGMLGTAAAAHPAGARGFGSNPYLAGRMVWVKRPKGVAGLCEDDPVVFFGLLERLQPDPENLAAYRLELSDPLGHLADSLGVRLGSGRLLPGLLVDGEETVSGRRGNDRFCFTFRRHPALAWETVTVALTPGSYDAEPGSGGERHIAAALKEALDEAAPGLFAALFVDDARHLHIKVQVDDTFRLLAGERPLIDQDSILPTLGFDIEKTEILQNPDGVVTRPGEGRKLMELVGQRPIHSGVGAHNRKLFLAHDALDEGALGRFAGGHVARIEEEVLYYDALRLDPGSDPPRAHLVYPVDADETLLCADDASDFPEDGGIVRIDAEQIRYQRREGSHYLTGCTRGVWGSRAAAHDSAAEITVLSLPYLSGCVRGLYGTTATAHEGGVLIQEIISSDRLSQPRAGKLVRRPAAPLDFLMDLLDASRPFSRGGLAFGPLLDTSSIARLAEELPLSFDASFRRLILPDEQVRDVVSDLCRSLGMVLGVNARGRLDLLCQRPLLRHEEDPATLTHRDLVAAPVMQWREDLRINRVEVRLDHELAADDFATRLVVDDDRGGESLDGQDRECVILSRCLRSGRVEGSEASGEGWAYDLAWRIIRRYNRFLTSLSLECTLAAAEGLGPLDRVRVSSAALPWGDGTRGLSDVVYQVVELERDLAASRARLTLLEQGKAEYAGIAPCWEVVEWDPTDRVLTLSGADYWPPDLAPAVLLQEGDRLCVSRCTPEGDFAQSDPVMVLSCDASAWETLGQLDLALAHAPSLAPLAGDQVRGAPWDEQAASSRLKFFLHLGDADAGSEPDFLYAY